MLTRFWLACTGMEKEVRWVFTAMFVIIILLLFWYFAFRTGTDPGVCSVQPGGSSCGGY